MDAEYKFLKEHFEYDNGNLYNKLTGEVVGYVDSKSGYLRTMFKGKHYLVHRIIFCLHHGYMPSFVDHKDRIRINNNIDNLRDADIYTNSQNRQHMGGASKHIGVSKLNGKWCAKIGYKRKRIYLGSFETELEAAVAYNKAATEYYGEYAKLNEV